MSGKVEANAWIPADTDEGRDHWEALQTIHRRTEADHNGLHQAVVGRLRADPGECVRNQLSFVFRCDDPVHGDMFPYGKGGDPARSDYAGDASGLKLIPRNMAEPVLGAWRDAGHSLGFSPHGARHSFLCWEHHRRNDAMTPLRMMAAETPGPDIRFLAGGIDASELPSGNKRDGAVTDQIRDYGLPMGRLHRPLWLHDGGRSSAALEEAQPRPLKRAARTDWPGRFIVVR